MFFCTDDLTPNTERLALTRVHISLHSDTMHPVLGRIRLTRPASARSGKSMKPRAVITATPGATMSHISADEAGGPNVVAFLDAIACSELGPAMLRLSDDGYNVLVGSTPTKPLLFSSYATHPNVFNSALRSTAAGRYQELFRNWVAYQPLLRLPDFGPLSQDRLALQQLKEARAIVPLQQGRVTQAVMLCAHLWASLPGADYGQHEQELAQIVDWFRAAGGTLA